jgi:hypothetical protein
MSYRAAISIVGAVGIFASTNANALTGLNLYQSCQEKSQSALDFACIAYVHGFLDGIAFGRGIGMKAPKVYCPPKAGISVDQGRLIIEKYLRNHPEKLHTEAGELAFSALVII